MILEALPALAGEDIRNSKSEMNVVLPLPPPRDGDKSKIYNLPIVDNNIDHPGAVRHLIRLKADQKIEFNIVMLRAVSHSSNILFNAMTKQVNAANGRPIQK